MSILDRIRQWWRAEISITQPLGRDATIIVADVNDGDYRIDIDGRVIEYRTKWWDTRRSIARKLRRRIRR